MQAKPFFVILVFVMFIAVFAGGAIGNTNLTGSTATVGSNSPAFVSQNLVGGAQTSQCGSSYTVQSGDTLFRIAQNCSLTVNIILADNPSIINPNLIRVGQKLALRTTPAQAAVIPTAAPKPAAAATTVPANSAGSTDLDKMLQQMDNSKTAASASAASASAAPTSVTPTAILVTAAVTSATPAALIVATGTPQAGPIPNTSGPAGLRPGDVMTVDLQGFLANQKIRISIAKEGAAAINVSDAVTDDHGVYRAALEIPHAARPGEIWVVIVRPVSNLDQKIISAPFEIAK